MCVCVTRKDLMNVKEKRQLSSAFVFFKVSMNVKQKRSAIIINIYQRPVQGYKLTAHFEWSMTLSKVFYCWKFLNTKIQNSLNCLLSISSSFQKWLPASWQESCISELRKNHSQEKSCHKLSVTLIFIPPSQGVASYPGEIAAAEKERHLLWFTPSCKKDMQLSSAISYHTPPKFTVTGMIWDLMKDYLFASTGSLGHHCHQL